MFHNLAGFGGSLFDDLRRLQESMDELSGVGPTRPAIRSTARGAYPPINVGSTSAHVDVYVFAAGLDTDKLEVSLHQNVLTLSGERMAADEGVDYYRRERFDGAFRRAITLPDDIDPDRVEAGYRDGVLHVRLHRREVAGPRKIAVK